MRPAYSKEVPEIKSESYSTRVPLELLCLALLKEKDMYGYEITLEINRRSNNLLSVNVTSVYLKLHNLAEIGYLSITYSKTSGPRGRQRAYYHFEDAAQPYYERLLDEYRRTTQGVAQFFENSLSE